MSDKERLEKLEKFYKAVAKLTLNHDQISVVVGYTDREEITHDYAVVYPSKLGPLLEEIDKDWWKQ